MYGLKLISPLINLTRILKVICTFHNTIIRYYNVFNCFCSALTTILESNKCIHISRSPRV